MIKTIQLKYLIIVFSFIFIGCLRKEQKQQQEKYQIKIDSCLKRASNSEEIYKYRLLNNRRAFSLLETSINDSLNRIKLIKVAMNSYSLNDWKYIKKVAETLLKWSSEKKSFYFIGESYRWKGIYYENLSINDSAFYYFSKAEKFFIRQNNFKKRCQISVEKGLLQYYTNNFVESEQSLIKALKIARKFKIKDSEYDCYIYLQMNSNQLQDYVSAINYGKKALELVKKNNQIFNPEDVAFCCTIIGHSYKESKNVEQAVKYYKLALQKDLQCERYPIIYTNLLDNYAQIELAKKNFINAKELHFLASKIREEYNIDQGKNYNKLFLSEYYCVTNQMDEAFQNASQAFNISKNYRNPKDMLLSLKQLIRVDPKNTLKYSSEYIKISDSMQLLERQTRNKFAKIAYETEEITREKETAVRKNWIVLGITTVILLIFGLTVIIITQRHKQKQLQLQQIQQKANEEIYNLLLDQQNKTDQGRKIEKKRIAQDLHDCILNRLASTRLNLHNIAVSPTQENLQKCHQFIDGIQDIEKEIRNIAHNLNKGALSNTLSFVALIQSFVEEQKVLGMQNQHLEIDPTIDWELISGYKKVHVFRIMQEAFQNINKHSQAKNVITSLLKKEGQLWIEIFDDGNGFSLKKKKKGIGLQNIFSRAKSCNGIAEIKTRDKEGTTVVIKIPIQKT